MKSNKSNEIIIGVSQITIVDMNDFQPSETPPENPKKGTVWLDMSVNPPVFKVWDGEKWVLENDWQDKVNSLEDSVIETIQNLEGTKSSLEVLKKSVDLKAETEYVDRIKQELIYGGKNVMPYSYPRRENVHSFWTSSNTSISSINITDYTFAIDGNDDYFIAGEKIFKFSVNGVKATQQSISYVQFNVINENKYIKLKPNTKYTFSVWVNKNSFCDKFKFTIFSKSTGREFATSNLHSPANDIFKRYSLTFTTDATEEYYVAIYNYIKPGASSDSNIYLYNMIIEKDDATDTWSPCLDDVNSSSVIYMEETLRQLKSNFKVSDDKIIASVTDINEYVESVDGTVKEQTKWIKNTQMSIESGQFFVQSSNFLPGNVNLMPYTNLNIKDIQKYWQVTPKGSISKRLYDFGEVSAEDNFLYSKNVLMISCTPLDASSITDSILTVNVMPDRRKLVLETGKKYTISYYIYITDRIKSAKCRIWNVAKNNSLDAVVEKETTVTKYTEHFVKVQSSFSTTYEDTEYYPQIIIEMNKDLLRDANVYLSHMMIQTGITNITWASNEDDLRLITTDQLNDEMSNVNNKFLEFGDNLSDLNKYLDGAFKDGIIDSTEAENIRESLRYLDIEKRTIDRQYAEIMNNPSLASMVNTASFDDILPMDNDDIAFYAGPVISETKVLEAFRNGRFKIRYRLTSEVKGDETNHFISKNGANYEATKPVKFGENYEVTGDGLPAGDNRVTIKVINNQGQSVSPNIIVTIKANTKDHLTFSKTDYDSKYNSLITIINRVLNSGIVTEANKTEVNNAFTIYGTALAELHGVFNSALDEIAEAKVSALSQQMDGKMASFSVTANEVVTKVESTEEILSGVQNNIGDIEKDLLNAQKAADNAAKAAQTAQSTADTANREAGKANTALGEFSNDNKLTASEKQSTKLEWDKIVGEKAKIIAEADKFGVSRSDYDSKYNTLNTYITPLLTSLTTTSDIVGTTFRSHFANYYNSRQDVLNGISTKAKQLADAAQGTANTANTNAQNAVKAAAAAQGTADTAKREADTANGKLGEYSNDNKLTASEKQATKLEWDKIVGEKTKIVAEADKFGVSRSDYDSKYNTLNTYVTPLLSNLTTTSDIVGTTFRSHFASYYNSRQDVLNAISTKAKQLADTAQGTANTANTNAQNAAKAAQTAQSTADTANREAGKANTALGEFSNDNKLTASEKQSTKLEWDKIVGEKAKIIAEADKFGVSRSDYDSKYNTLNTYITPLLTSLTTTSDIVGTTFRSHFANYYNSRQDVLNGISTKAKQLADAAQGTANTANTNAQNAAKAAAAAQGTADTAKREADTANGKIGEYSNDNKLTASEKQSTKLEWDKIVGEKSKIVSEADKFGVSRSDYDNKYNTLNTYITPLLSNLTTTSDIVGTTFRSHFINYYNSRQDVLNAISTKAKQLADNAQGTANTANQNVQAVGKRVSTVEEAVKSDAIIRTVTESAKYTSDLGGKANKGDSYTKSEIDNKKFQNSSQVSETVNGLQVKVSKSGGYNEVKNSCGKGGQREWRYHNAWHESNRDYIQLRQTGAECAIRVWTNSTSEGYAYSNRFPLKPNTKYTISMWYLVADKSRGIDVHVLGSDDLNPNESSTGYSWTRQIKGDSANSGGIYKYFFSTITTTSGARSGVIRIDNNGSTDGTNCYVAFTKLLVTEGEIDFLWSQHPAEAYEGIVELGGDGVQVKRSDSTGHTLLDHTALSVMDKGATIASFGEISSIPELHSGKIYAEELVSDNVVTAQEGVTLYVDMSNGSDNNTGESGSKLKTIQEALDRLKKYILDETITINVTGTGNQSIRASGLVGAGKIVISLDTSTRLHCNTFDFINCSAQIEIIGNKPSNTSTTSAQVIQSDGGTLFYARGCTMIFIKEICIVGNKSGSAITAVFGSRIVVRDSEIDRFKKCVNSEGSSHVSMLACYGSDIVDVAAGLNGGCVFLESWANNSIVPQYSGRTYSSSGSAMFFRPGLEEGKGVKTPGKIYPPSYVPPVVPPAVQYTKTWTPTKVYSDETLNGWSDRSELIQGYYSGWSTGRWTGYIKFNDAAIRSTISGGTNLSGRLYIKRRSSSHGNFSGSQIALYGSDGTAIDTSSTFNLGTERWISLNSSIVSKIQNGAIKYFYVKWDSSNANRYIKFESTVKLEITYKK